MVDKTLINLKIKMADLEEREEEVQEDDQYLHEIKNAQPNAHKVSEQRSYPILNLQIIEFLIHIKNKFNIKRIQFHSWI